MYSLIKMAKDAVNDDKPERAIGLALIAIAEELQKLNENKEREVMPRARRMERMLEAIS